MPDHDDAKRERDRGFREEALCWLPDVARFALSLARMQSDADDLVQETYLRAYRSWHQYEPGTECRGWLFTICRNEFLRTHARQQREVELDAPEMEARQAAAVHDAVRNTTLEDIWLRVDLAPAIQQALAALPEVLRTAVILVDLQDLKYEEAAAVLGVPVGTVRSRLFRGRRQLQEPLLIHAQDAGYAPRHPSSDGGEVR